VYDRAESDLRDTWSNICLAPGEKDDKGDTITLGPEMNTGERLRTILNHLGDQVEDAVEITFSRIALPPKFGGMGIPSLRELSDSASVASAYTCIPWLRERIEGLQDITSPVAHNPRDTGLGWGELDAAWTRVWNRADAADGGQGEHSLLVFATLTEAAANIHATVPKIQRLLSSLSSARDYKSLHTKVCEKFENQFKDDKNWSHPATRWFAQAAASMTSLSGHGATAWKDAWPSDPRLQLEPLLFRSGISFELNLRQEAIHRAYTRGVKVCKCGHCTKHKLSLGLDDPDIVHHYLTRKEESSERGASAYGTHNAMRNVICDIAKHAGYTTETRDIDSFLRTHDKANIPDAYIKGWAHEQRPYFIDVVVSHPCYGCPLSMRALDKDPIGSMRKTKGAIYEEGSLIKASVAKKVSNYDKVAARRHLDMAYHALETQGRMSTDLVNFLRKAAEHAASKSRELGAGGLPERRNILVQSNLQKFLRWVATTRIRSITTRIVSAVEDELRKKEWREADAPMEPEELVHEAYRDGLTMHEDAVFGLNN
jgi:hypothetical protein